MRARWVILIAGGFLVLAIALFLTRSRPSTLSARLIGQTNEGAFYVLEVTNRTGKRYIYTAWTAYSSNRSWNAVRPMRLNGQLEAKQAETFTLTRPSKGPRRVVISSCCAEPPTAMEVFLGKLQYLVGLDTSTERSMYIDAP
jgi:hypothetical protein